MAQRKALLRLEDHTECEIVSSAAGSTLIPRARRAAARSYTPHSFIWTVSDHHAEIFFLRRGRVHIGSMDALGHETLIQVVLPGDFFGEWCFCALREEPVGTFARAIVLSEVTSFSFEEFQLSLMRDKALLAKLMELFCRRLIESDQRVKILSLRDARQRLGRLLLHLAALRGRSTNKHFEQVSLTVSHWELASLAALSRPHVSLLMAKFRRQGLLFYDRSTPLALDVTKLRKSLDAWAK